MTITDREVQDLAERVLPPILNSSGYESVETRPALDDDGDSSLLITVRFFAGHVADTQATIEARLALWRALQDRGDERFPHFRYDFAGEEVPGEAGE